jgi:hypothetical protein
MDESNLSPVASCHVGILVGGIPTPLKNMSSSVGKTTIYGAITTIYGVILFPIYGKIKTFQTTNQIRVLILPDSPTGIQNGPKAQLCTYGPGTW